MDLSRTIYINPFYDQAGLQETVAPFPKCTAFLKTAEITLHNQTR